MANREEVIKSLIILSAYYPKNNLPKPTISAYITALLDIPNELLLVAISDLGSTSVFFPTAAEIRDHTFTLLEETNNVPTKYEAWYELTRNLGGFFYGGEPEFSHPIIGMALKGIGGWRRFCNSHNLISERKHFLDSYEASLEKKRREVRRLKETRSFMEQLRARTNTLLTMDKVERVLSAKMLKEAQDNADDPEL